MKKAYRLRVSITFASQSSYMNHEEHKIYEIKTFSLLNEKYY